MKIPKSIPCASHEFTCRFIKNLIRDRACRGEVVFTTQEVNLDDTLEGTTLAVVFWHEVLHIIDRHYCNESTDENDIASLAEGLAQVMKSIGITFER